MLPLQRECFPAKFKTWKNYYFLHPFLQAFSILLFFTLFIDLGSHFEFILEALGSLLACFFQYFWRPNLKMRKYWKNEAQTPPRRNPPASGRTRILCPLPPRTPPSFAYATLSVRNVQAWRVQALPVIHFWVSFGIIFKHFLANSSNNRNLQNSAPAAVGVLPSKIQHFKN